MSLLVEFFNPQIIPATTSLHKLCNKSLKACPSLHFFTVSSPCIFFSYLQPLRILQGSRVNNVMGSCFHSSILFFGQCCRMGAAGISEVLFLLLVEGAGKGWSCSFLPFSEKTSKCSAFFSAWEMGQSKCLLLVAELEYKQMLRSP